MTEKDIIEKLQALKSIKPNKEWVVFAKSQILADEKKNGFVAMAEMFQVLRFAITNKYAIAGAVILFVIIGTFGFSLKSGPGEMMFAIKKAVEDSQMVFMTGEEKVKFNLSKANQQMDDLTKAVQENNTQKIQPALNGYKASISAVTQNLLSEKDKNRIKEVIANVMALENKESLVQSLGVELGENPEKDSALVKLISDQVKELEARKDLSVENRKNLYQVKDFCEKGYFTEALELILVINNTK